MDPLGFKEQVADSLRRGWARFRECRPRCARLLRLSPLWILLLLALGVVLAATYTPEVGLGTSQAAILADLGIPCAVPADTQEFVQLGRKHEYRFQALLGECSPFTAEASGEPKSAAALAQVQGSVFWYERFFKRAFVYVFDDEQRLVCVIEGRVL